MTIHEIRNLRVPLPRSHNIPGPRDFKIRESEDRLAQVRYRVSVRIYARWISADGEPLEKDLDNLMKPLMDALATAYGLGKRGRGDKWFWEEHAYKCDWGGDEPHAVIDVERV